MAVAVSARSHVRRMREMAVCLRGHSQHVHEHSTLVADLARIVAMQLGLAGRELAQVVMTAEFHDIGKLAIADAILSKPSALNEDEWQQVRRHTITGEQITGLIPPLAHIGKAVRSSHERFDGTGYPDGLAGDAIPLASRIVFVCDSFEAMTSDRPYRPAMSPAEAFAELECCAGTQFDPRVVAAFVAARGKIAKALASRTSG